MENEKPKRNWLISIHGGMVFAEKVASYLEKQGWDVIKEMGLGEKGSAMFYYISDKPAIENFRKKFDSNLGKEIDFRTLSWPDNTKLISFLIEGDSTSMLSAIYHDGKTKNRKVLEKMKTDREIALAVDEALTRLGVLMP